MSRLRTSCANPSASIQTSLFHWKARLSRLCKPVYWSLDAKRPQVKKENVLVVDEKPKADARRTMVVVS